MKGNEISPLEKKEKRTEVFPRVSRLLKAEVYPDPKSPPACYSCMRKRHYSRATQALEASSFKASRLILELLKCLWHLSAHLELPSHRSVVRVSKTTPLLSIPKSTSAPQASATRAVLSASDWQRHMCAWKIALAALLVSSEIWSSEAYRNSSSIRLPQPEFSLQEGRPDDCPPCFNCNLDAFQCAQFGTCNKYNGKCSCPAGFGGEDCSRPLCDSLAKGKDRVQRGEGECECEEGWEGINCNVCKSNDACNALMPEGEGGICYKDFRVVKENHQICNITNRKIVDQLKESIPQITFSCNAEDETCNFQCRYPVFSWYPPADE